MAAYGADTAKVSMRDRVQGVKDYCVKNYENGWSDLVIETMDDMGIVDVIEGTSTVKGAIWKMSVHWGPYAERRREVMSEVF